MRQWFGFPTNKMKHDWMDDNARKFNESEPGFRQNIFRAFVWTFGLILMILAL